MKALVDINVLLDVPLRRESWPSSDRTVSLCARGEVQGWLLGSAMPMMDYVMSKELGKGASLQAIRSFSDPFSIIPLRSSVIKEALTEHPENFEDGLQMAAARQFHLDYIVTRNVRHFRNSPVPAVTPEEFIDIFRRESANQKVPFVDLQGQLHETYNDADDRLSEVIQSCAFVLGPQVAAFERDFASFCSTKYCVGANSGTSALHLALLALGIGNGDEVITVPNTFAATAEAIVHAGASPVFVDVDERTFNIDVSKIEGAISSRTKAIIPVHLCGQPADMDPILEIAERHGLKVIEDACQAHGAEYKGRRAGSIGHVGCFSFYPSKNLGSFGDAGALVTNDEAVFSRAKMLRDHGASDKYHHDVMGYNCRISTLQAAILSAKLPCLDKWNENRRKNAALYSEALDGVNVITPYEPGHLKSVYHLYMVRVRNRDMLRQHLADNGISAGLHYPVPLHLQGAFSHLGYQKGDFPVAENLAEQILSLPMFPELKQAAIVRCAELIGQFLMGEARRNQQ